MPVPGVRLRGMPEPDGKGENEVSEVAWDAAERGARAEEARQLAEALCGKLPQPLDLRSPWATRLHVASQPSLALVDSCIAVLQSQDVATRTTPTSANVDRQRKES